MFRCKVNATAILAIGFVLIACLPASTQGSQARQADYMVSRSSIEIKADCTSKILLIKWTNLEESNVTGFKVHSSSHVAGSERIENRWLNSIAIVAKGADEEYTVLDSSFAPNTFYRFRLYGFEPNNLLSKAKQTTLHDSFVIYCTSLPLAIS